MSHNTISVSPLPESTTIDKIKEIFGAFSVKNVHIEGNTAYVEFADQGDLENLDIQFDNYEVSDLNNAKIDKAEFDWSTIHKQNGDFSAIKSQSSDKHQDLMAADIDNLIVIQNCDHQKLNSLSVQAIRQIFKDFHSVNRIVKRNNDVIVEFTDVGEIEKLQATFNLLNVPQLGYNSQIQKADNNKITPEAFVNQWSKIHNESAITQESSNLGYKEEKPASPQQKHSGNQLGYGSYEEKQSPGHKVLHDDIIPPFEKQTSMEVNFLNEQSQLGYKEQPTHEAIPQATTHQELDYTTEIKINDDDHHQLGYSKEVEEQAQRRQEQERKRKQEEQIQRKAQEEHRKIEQQRKKQQEEENRRRIELEQQQKREEEQRRKKIQEELQRKQQEQQNRRRREEEELQRKKEEEQMKKLQEQQKRRQEQERRKKQEQVKKRLEQERKRKIQQERLSQQLKEKLEAQKQKFKTQTQKLGYQQQHEMPTESQNAAQEVQAIRKAEQSIEKQLGYAVNMAKAESAELLQAGLNLLKGKQEKKQQPAKKVEKLGYEKQQPKEIGLNLIYSGLDFLKDSYQKFQDHFGQNATGQSGSKKSQLSEEKWSVKPDVSVLKPAGGQSRVLRTLVTISLLIWVIFLLMQGTSEEVQTINEIEIPTSSV